MPIAWLPSHILQEYEMAQREVARIREIKKEIIINHK